MIDTNMDRTSISIVFASILLQTISNGKDINFVFLVEPIQEDITNDISGTFKDIQLFQLDFEIRNSILTITDDMEADTQKLRSILSEGFSVVIDFTYLPRTNDLNWKEQVIYTRLDLNISPVLRMFGEFLKEKTANDVALIFENDQDADEALFHIIRGFPLRVVIINAAENNLVQRLKSLRPCPSYVAIFAKEANMDTIFTKIRRAKLFVRPREWHFIFLDIMDKGNNYEGQAEHATKFSLNASEICQALRMDDRYCASEFKLQKAVIFEIMRSILNFLNTNENILAESYNRSNLNISQINIDFEATVRASQFLAMAEDRFTYNINMSINSFSNINESSTDLAIWQEGKLKKINATISPARRFFRIGTVEAIPWSYIRRDPGTGKISLDQEGNPIWEGYCVDFIQMLSEYMNFDYELVPRMNAQFGKRRSNGSWDGSVGDLVTGETDFLVAALKMTAEREEVIDFIAPYFEQTGISIVIRKAVRQTSLFKFMTVLRLEVWLSIVAALIATAVMIWLLDKHSPYSARNNKKAYPYPCREFSLKESFWFALTSFTPQGGGEAPKAFSGRILVAAYWLFVVLMLATFTANLAAFLTVERMQAPVQSLEQLARQSRINYTVVEGSDTHKYFINMKNAEDTLYRMWKELALNATSDQGRYRIWDYPIKEQYGHILLAINSSGPVKNATEGFHKVNEHGNADFAFIHDSAEIKYEITRNCNLTEVGEVFAEQPYAIAVQQGSHLSDEISYAILELQRDRYFEGLTAKYWNHSLNKECSRAEEQEGITLESLGGVFIATLFGLALAMITLGIEVVYYRKKEKQSIKIASIREVIPVRTVSGTTPPPTFEAATFRGRKIPRNITLGNEFKPIKTKKHQKITFSSQQSKDLTPIYYE